MNEAWHPKLVLCDNFRDIVGREMGGGFRMEGTHIYLRQFILIYGKNQFNIVK